MIGQFYDGFYPGSGGIESHIKDLTSHMKMDFEIIADRVPGLPDEQNLSDRVRVRRVGPRNTVVSSRTNVLNARPFFPVRVAADLVRIRSKKRCLRQANYSLVHFHGSQLGSSLAKLARMCNFQRLAERLTDWRFLDLPKVLTVHGLLSFMSPNPYYENLEKSFIAQFPYVICVDLALRDRIEAYLKGRRDRPEVLFVPNGIDLDAFTRRPANPTDHLRVGFAGRLEASRGLDIVKELVASDSRQMQYFIAGLGNAREIRNFDEAIRGSNVQFYPNLDSSSMPSFYEKIDVLVNPVVVPGISRVALECMATGRPVIMSSNGNRYPVVDGETGFIVPHDSLSYANKLIWLSENREVAVECGRKGYELVRKEFGVDRMCDRIRAVYDVCSSRA